MVGSLTVRVQDGNGDPVEGAAVQIVTGRQAVIIGLETDSNGETGPWKVPPGQHTAKVAIRGYEVTSAETVTVADSESKTIDVTVNQLPYQTSGTVNDRGSAGMFGIDRDVGTGVYGVSPTGYGLETPDDARVGGRLEVGGLDVADTLPHYSGVGDDPARVQNALTMLFTEDAWSDGHLRGFTVHNETTPAFQGSVLTRDGKVFFAPYQSDNIGIYDPRSGTYTSGPAHGRTKPAFSGAALAPSGSVVFASYDAGTIYVFDTDAQTKKPRVTAMHPLVNNS